MMYFIRAEPNLKIKERDDTFAKANYRISDKERR